MAFRIVRAFETLTKCSTNYLSGTSYHVPQNGLNFLTSNLPIQCLRRTNTFFCKVPAAQLWKSVISVSNAGKKRGRGRGAGRKLLKNLNKGQIIGKGKINMVWPGLNTPILQGSSLMEHQRLPEDPTREERIIKMRETTVRSKREKVSPLERGWSSATLAGRSVGPPDPVQDQTFEGFDTKVLEIKIVCCMSNNMGRKRRHSCFVVTGNKNGLAGFALRKSPDPRAAIKNAKNRAGQKLMYIERYNNHTVYHDFYTRFGNTKIFVTKKPEGYGLVCHRAIKEICELVGIKDLHAKIEGSTNLQCIVKAFFLGLLRQRTHKQLAEEKKLHLVEFKKENDYFPTVVASPSTVRTEKEIDPDEVMDFTQYVLNDNIVLQKKKYPPFYTKHYSWTLKLRKQEYLRNQQDVRLRMYMDYGELRSFLTDKYPEAKPKFWKKIREPQEVVEE